MTISPSRHRLWSSGCSCSRYISWERQPETRAAQDESLENELSDAKARVVHPHRQWTLQHCQKRLRMRGSGTRGTCPGANRRGRGAQVWSAPGFAAVCSDNLRHVQGELEQEEVVEITSSRDVPNAPRLKSLKLEAVWVICTSAAGSTDIGGRASRSILGGCAGWGSHSGATSHPCHRARSLQRLAGSTTSLKIRRCYQMKLQQCQLAVCVCYISLPSQLMILGFRCEVGMLSKLLDMVGGRVARESLSPDLAGRP